MDPEKIETQVNTDSPAGEVVSPRPGEEITETVVVQPVEDQDLVTFQTELENAKTPEEKEQARRGFQQRQESKRAKETQDRELELRAIRAETRAETLERIGVRQEVAPQQQVQEPVIPAPQLPPRPDASQWTDAEGYEDQDKKIEVLGAWQAQCAILNYQHQQNVETVKAAAQQLARESQALIDDVIQAHPEFADKMRIHQPTKDVAEAIGAMAKIKYPGFDGRKAAIETANYLVNNPVELRQLNSMHPEAVKVVLGQLAKSLLLPPVQPNKVSTAPDPVKPVVSTETHETFDPEKADMNTYGRHHPACPPWLK